MPADSIRVSDDPQIQYLLRIGDTALVLAQRTAEWTGHAPVLEEDIALANIGLDLLGQARGVLTRVGELEGRGHDEDQLAFLRDERDYRNVTLVELPRGDFAFTVVRNTMMATFFKLLLRKGREFYLPEIIAAFIDQYKERKGIHTVKLTTAVPVSEELKKMIMDKISADKHLKRIELVTAVDESLIGGFVLEIGDELVDGSIAFDLKNIRKQFQNNDFIYKIR